MSSQVENIELEVFPPIKLEVLKPIEELAKLEPESIEKSGRL